MSTFKNTNHLKMHMHQRLMCTYQVNTCTTAQVSCIFLVVRVGAYASCVDVYALNNIGYSFLCFQKHDFFTSHEMFSFIDGCSGYNQIKLVVKVQPKISFTIPLGTLCYIVYKSKSHELYLP